MKEQIRTFIQGHFSLLLGLSFGLLVGILMLTIGFFSTLLLVVCGGIGALLGGVPALRRVIAGWFSQLFEKLTHKF